jgi:hypothetical protein
MMAATPQASHKSISLLRARIWQAVLTDFVDDDDKDKNRGQR